MLKEINVVTIFPEIVKEWMKYGIVNKGIQKNIFSLNVYDLREWGLGNSKQIDDAPYGGGPGMVMMVEPIDKAITNIASNKNIFLTPSGKSFDQTILDELLEMPSLTIVCGRYEGFDKRVIDMHADYEISLGSVVVSGGEIPGMFVIEALVRNLPGVLGNEESLYYETFNDGMIDFPVYTRPERYKDYAVPEVLLSGDHKKIEKWKKEILKDI